MIDYLSTPRSATSSISLTTSSTDLASWHDVLDHAADHAEHRRRDEIRLAGAHEPDLDAGLERAAKQVARLGEELLEAQLASASGVARRQQDRGERAIAHDVRERRDDLFAQLDLRRRRVRIAFALERLTWTDDGRISYKLKRPWPDGRTHLVMEPVAFLRRLVGIIPPPRRRRSTRAS